MKDRDPVGAVFGLVEILRSQQHAGAPRGQALDSLPDFEAGLWVESAGAETAVAATAVWRRERVPPVLLDPDLSIDGPTRAGTGIVAFGCPSLRSLGGKALCSPIGLTILMVLTL